MRHASRPRSSTLASSGPPRAGWLGGSPPSRPFKFAVEVKQAGRAEGAYQSSGATAKHVYALKNSNAAARRHRKTCMQSRTQYEHGSRYPTMIRNPNAAARSHGKTCVQSWQPLPNDDIVERDAKVTRSGASERDPPFADDLRHRARAHKRPQTIHPNGGHIVSLPPFLFLSATFLLFPPNTCNPSSNKQECRRRRGRRRPRCHRRKRCSLTSSPSCKCKRSPSRTRPGPRTTHTCMALPPPHPPPTSRLP